MSVRIVAAASALAILAGCTQAVDNPAQSPAYVAAALGYDAYKQGDLVAAETQFESALASEPDNPYALLGLGAVRENTGDYTGARQLYTAARGTGTDAQANYTYITEQRLERVANIDVASLADENLARLTIRQAAVTPPLTTDFVSYDDPVAIVPTTTQDVAYAAPAPTTFNAADGNYQAVGSYDSYVASTGGIVEPAYAAKQIDTAIYAEPAFSDALPVVDIVPASYETTPYYEAPLSYNNVAEPAQYEPVASVPPTYAPLSQSTLSTPPGPAGTVLQYGQAFGDPVDLVAISESVMEKDATSATQTGGLIFLGDG